VTPGSRGGGLPNELGFLYSRKAGAAASSVGSWSANGSDLELARDHARRESLR
jgi:hypothetical protein